MAGWTLIVWSLIVVILTPISTFVLGEQFFTARQLVIGNEQLLSWLVSLPGVIYLLLSASLLLTAWILYFAGISQIVSDDVRDKSANLQTLLFRIIRRIPILFRFCLCVVSGALFLFLPLAGGFGLIYHLMLDTYDINYYLSETPMEWHLAILAGLTLFIGWVLITLYLIAKTVMALPAYLHSNMSIRKALAWAWNQDSRRSKKTLSTILTVAFAWILLRLIVDGLLFLIASELTGLTATYIQNIRIIALITGVYLAGSLTIDTLITFIGFVHVSILITQFYHDRIEQKVSVSPSPVISKNFTRYLARLLQPKWLAAAAVIFMLGGFWMGGYLIERITQTEPDSPVYIAAHRAGPPPAPENSLKALERTLQTSAEYTEIDVQLSRDSVVVVAHDFDLMRIANDPARISETDFDVLREIVRKNAEAQGQQHTLNTLDEFLKSSRGRIKLMVELKQKDPELINRTIESIRRYNMIDETIILSMNLEPIRRIQSDFPGINTAYVSSLSLGNINRLPVQMLAVNQRAISHQLVEEAHNNDLEVYAWTVNNASRMANMIERGVDGIITDDPELGIQVREEMQQLTATERLLLQFQQFAMRDDQ